MRQKTNAVAYLHLPPRTAIDTHAVADLAFPYALTMRGKLTQTGMTSLTHIRRELAQAPVVVLLIAASDVTLLRVEVPPLPAHRLHLALPALVEDRLIGDVADCVFAAGKELAGKRVVAVMQRDWLLTWTNRLRASGFSRLQALPVQLCLPMRAGHLAAAWMANGDAMELVIRYSADEGIGLPLTNADDVTLPDQILQLLATLAGEQAVDLSLPADFIGELASAQASGRHPVRLSTLNELNWATLIEAANATHAAGLDLMSGLTEVQSTGIDWRPWRWPLRLAAALLIVNILALLIDSWRMQHEAADLRQMMLTTYRRAFPNEAAVADPLARMQRKITASRQQAGESVPDDFLALTAAFGDAWSTLQTHNEATPQAIAGLMYRDRLLEVRFKPEIKPSVQSAQAALATRALQLSASTAQDGASLWHIRSHP